MSSSHSEREEKILKFWQEKEIFQKSLAKNEGRKEFIFYEGPPTANGHPGIHHLEARAFKDAIPRYKTMQGYYVRRRGGWDTHGLPVELQVEKELGLKSKKEIETYGVAAFNEKCKENVWKYIREWESFTDRMGYWVDLKNPYITYKPYYIESVWNVIKKADDEGLLYKDYKVVPWCPRCGTGLSSHELAQGYEDVKDLSVTVKFRVTEDGGRRTELGGNTYILAWTTTPWTLPGNVALAVSEKIEYVKIKKGEEFLILAKERLSVVEGEYEIAETFKGKDLLGTKYEPLYPFVSELVADKSKLSKAFQVYSADFVTTTDGTGVVHTAVMYGQDDFELGTKNDLPKVHIVDEAGNFISGTGFLENKFVKDPETDVAIIKDLAGRGLLFAKEKYSHSYPFCWRCHTPLIYYARDSWYIRMSELRKKLVKENEKINWEPDYIKDGRFGEWLREVKDWAISRERYWGTPLPVWNCEQCKKIKVVGSVEEIAQKSKNEYFVMRHGEADNNVQRILNSDPNKEVQLTENGKGQVHDASDRVANENFDLIFVSPLKRARQTVDILKDNCKFTDEQIIVDDRIAEMSMASWEGKSVDDFIKEFPIQKRFEDGPGGIENYVSIKHRVGEFMKEMESKYEGKKILIVTHGSPSMMILSMAKGLGQSESLQLEMDKYIGNAELRKVEYKVLPLNSEYELDLHRPYIDEFKLSCKCGGVMTRAKEVMDVWLDSGSMPFAQDHYPFETKKIAYPADFISEAIDQTRGWFYTMHAVGVLMGKGRAYENVVCLGHILDSQGKKMSKSIGNVIDPFMLMDKYGADALRYWMYSVNQPGEPKNFDERTVDEIIKKVFNLTLNVLAFYKMYEGTGRTEDGGRSKENEKHESQNILDKWIVAKLNELNANVTNSLDEYKFLEPTRAIRDFVADLSQWYLRRSRDRFKEDGSDKEEALSTTRYVLLELAKMLAPFTPYLAEHVYLELGGEKESVHLEDWSKAGKVDEKLILNMESVRNISSKGLEARMSAKINVRQPLKTLKVKADKLSPELAELIKDEVNVKEVTFDKTLTNEVELDVNITPDLKEEGDLRELIRKIQDMRKEKGLSVGDKASLTVGQDVEHLVNKYAEQIKKTAGLSSIEVGSALELKV